METTNGKETANNGLAVQSTGAKTEVIKIDPVLQITPSERFTNSVLKLFSSNNGEIELPRFQQKLMQNYFIKLDGMLKELDAKNKKKSPEYQEQLAYVWTNVNMNKLSNDVIAWSSIGLDPTQPNHLSLIPYKNKDTNKWDVGFLPGYAGLEIKAKKYGLDIPDFFIMELVYTNDEFRQFKKDMNNRVEGYEFKVVSDFDRGEVMGGFYYIVYNDYPEKNKLKVFSLKDIEKRKPAYASAEFWGGEKQKWTNGKKDGMEKIDGWFDEMALKTIKRACYNSIVIDAEKIDENYYKILQGEKEMNTAKIENDILLNANKESLEFDDAEVVEDPSTTPPVILEASKPKQDHPQPENGGTLIEGPNF